MKENQSPLSKKTDQKENINMEEYDVEKVIHTILDSKKTWTPQEKMPLLVDEIDNLKKDLKIYLQNCDFDITAILDEATGLCAESKGVIEEMEACKTVIEEKTMAEIIKSIENHDKIMTELETVNFQYKIVGNVGSCDNFLKSFSEAKDEQSYSKAVEAVYGLLHYINIHTDGFSELEIYKAIKRTGQLILDSLWCDLHQEWDRMVSYSIKSETCDTVINLNITMNNSRACADILNALDITKKLTEKIGNFAAFLKKDVFIAILRNSCILSEPSDELLTITIKNNKCDLKPAYKMVIENMSRLLGFIHNKFDLQYGSGCTIMKRFGNAIAADLCDLLINECFVHTIPNNINELHGYNIITSDINIFEQYLVSIRVFPEDGLSLLSYMENVDVLFANCSSQHYLESARAIMLKDLSVTMSIGVEKIPEEASGSEKLSSDSATADVLDIFDKTIPKSLFYFPRCLISKTVQELLDLVYEITEEAVKCHDVVCKKYYKTVRLIFEMYDAVVPYYHENYLQTIPQYVALFHNNCMFLAHNLQLLGDKWMYLMDEYKHKPYHINFVDLVQKIRELGYKHLTNHMQQQRKQILDNIRSSDLNCAVGKDILGDNAEAAVRQCLRQLQLLKNVWIGVFPSNVFTKLMATLVNMFVDELIHRVCTVEDISIEMATQLTDMYTIVVKKSPQLFQTPMDVEKYVKSWIKLQELIYVLGGSLKDIENHWNEGKGPLAVHFKVEELRGLIKALFQNSQFRANLLSKIK